MKCAYGMIVIMISGAAGCANRQKQKGGKRRGKVIAVNDAPCRDCASREVGCHAGCERYKAYADRRKQALENRYAACLEGTSRKRSHERWLDQQKRRAR